MPARGDARADRRDARPSDAERARRGELRPSERARRAALAAGSPNRRAQAPTEEVRLTHGRLKLPPWPKIEKLHDTRRSKTSEPGN